MSSPQIRSLIVAAALVVPATAGAAPVERRLHSSSLEASSFLWNDWNKFQENYHPNYVADDDPKTAWVEGAANSGAGEWIRINVTDLDKTTKVRLKIRNGYQKSKGLFAANARAKDIVVRLLPSKTEVKATLTDKDGWQEVAVSQTAGKVRAVELAVTSVYEGKKYADLCISDIQVFATSETPDNPAFEKSKRKELLAWRSARVAAAKLFAKRKVDLPIHTGYKATVTDKEVGCNACEIAAMITAATADPGFKEWKATLAIAATTAADLEKLPRGQLAPTSKQSLPEVDGLVAVYLENVQNQWYPEDGLHLPLIDSVSAMFADQLRVLDVKDKTTPSDFAGEDKKCKGDDMTWVKRVPAADKSGPDVVQAVLVGRCGMLEERDGSYRASGWELLVYGAEGRLELVIANGMIDGYRWATEDGKPMVVGGRSMLGQGKIIETTKQK
jgi:hypothetical protein